MKKNYKKYIIIASIFLFACSVLLFFSKLKANSVLIDENVEKMLEYMHLDECEIVNICDYIEIGEQNDKKVEITIEETEIEEYINDVLYQNARYIVTDSCTKVTFESVVEVNYIVYDKNKNVIAEEKNNCLEMQKLYVNSEELYNLLLQANVNDNVELVNDDVIVVYTIVSCGYYDIPILSDEFILNISDKSKNIQEYKNEVRDLLTQQSISNIELELQKKVMDEIRNKSEFSISQNQVAEYAVDIVKAYEKEYEIRGENLYQTESEERDFFNRCYEEAKEYTEEYLIIGAIACKEGITVNNDEIRSILNELGYSEEAMSEEEMTIYLKYQIIRDKVYNKLLEKFYDCMK